MAKVTPTTKSCSEICYLITGSCTAGHYVQTTFDPVSTHALYRVHKADVDFYKKKIKEIGGKHIRVVSGRDRTNDFRIICFALAITPQEETKLKMEKEAEERRQQAIESKFTEIKLSPMLNAVGATNETAQRAFAVRLLNGALDPLLPFESYAVLEPPRDKDERRIIDIINKSNDGYAGCVGMCTLGSAVNHMVDLAIRMNKSITDEDKRERRRAACLHYGLKFLANCFTKD